jgi:citrate lyase beta subunit
MSLFRSLLFAPGNHPRRVEKALTLDADAVILDLEDACPITEKVATRAIVVEARDLHAHARRDIARGHVRLQAHAGKDARAAAAGFGAQYAAALDHDLGPGVVPDYRTARRLPAAWAERRVG